MLVFVERSNLVWGRGVFFPAFPDLGAALIAAGLKRAGVEHFFLGGNARWLDLLCDAPERLQALLKEPFASPRARRRLGPILRRGRDHFAATLAQVRHILEGREVGAFFDSVRLERAVGVLEGAFDLRCAEHVALHGEKSRTARSVEEVASPLVRAMLDPIVTRDPALVAFSIAGFGDPITREVMRALKHRGVPIVAGGWFALGCTAEACAALKKKWPADWVISGPGETVLPRLYEAVTAGEADHLSAADVCAMAESRKAGGAQRNQMGEIRADFSPFMTRCYLSPQPLLPIRSNDGCYWKKCAFCPQAHNQRPFVERAVADVMDDLDNGVQRFGVRDYFFVDECVSPRFAGDLSRRLRKRDDLDVRLTVMARPEKAFTPDLLQAMAEAGFRAVNWGVESGSARVLALMRKGTTPPQVAAVLRAARRAGLANYAFMMIGFPGETAADRRESIKWLKEMRSSVDGFQLSRFVVYQQSEVGRKPARFGLEVRQTGARSEVNTLTMVGERRGELKKALDALHRRMEKCYADFVSGRFVGALHRYYTARSLTLLLYQARRKAIEEVPDQQGLSALAPLVLEPHESVENEIVGKVAFASLCGAQQEVVRKAALQGRVVWLRM